MEKWGLHFPVLDARSHFNISVNTSAIRETPWNMENSTKTVVAELKLAQVQTLRTMHLTLGAFSLALALLTLHRIVSDAQRLAAVQVPLRKKCVAPYDHARICVANVVMQALQFPPKHSSRRDFPTRTGLRCGHPTNYFCSSAEHIP
jgi:hypothetical protein